MSEVKPLAALLRENRLLRSVAEKAIRLRRVGISCEQCEEALADLYENKPDITRSATQALMLEQAFQTALSAFDTAVMEAADAGMDWAKEYGIPKPRQVP